MDMKPQELKRLNATVLTHNSSIIMITHYGFFQDDTNDEEEDNIQTNS